MISPITSTTPVNDQSRRRDSESTSQNRRKKESIEEFKAKLVRLEKNKNDLESKMREFEQKIKASNTRLSKD